MKKATIKQTPTSYQGSVKVTLYDKGMPFKVVEQKNAGTVNLFTYLAKCLAGENVLAQRPCWLRAYDASDNDVLNFAVLFDGEYKITEGDNSNSPYAMLSLNFFVPSNLISSAITINKYRLISRNGTDESIFAIIDLDEPLSVSSNVGINVEWKLLLSNGG